VKTREMKKNQKKLCSLINKYVEKGLTEKEAMEAGTLFAAELQKWIFFDPNKIDYPELRFAVTTSEYGRKELGNYDRTSNIVTVSSNELIAQFAKGDDKKKLLLAVLFEVLPHEFRHFEQNAMTIYYESLDEKKRKHVEGSLFQIFHDTKRDIKLSKEDVDQIWQAMSPYIVSDEDKKEIIENYGTIDEYLKNVAFGSYLSLKHEEDARRHSVHKARMVLMDLQNSGMLSDKSKTWIEDIANYYQFVESDMHNQDRMDCYKKFEDFFDIENDVLIDMMMGDKKIDQDFREAFDRVYPILETKFRMNAFLINKTLDEKRLLLKNAIYNGASSFGRSLIDSIVNDPNFDKNKSDIQAEIFGWLKNASVAGENEQAAEEKKLIATSYLLGYNQILEPDQIYDISRTLIANGQIVFANSLLGDFNFNNIEREKQLDLKKMIVGQMEEAIELSKQHPNFENYRTVDSMISLLEKLSSGKTLTEGRELSKLINEYKNCASNSFDFLMDASASKYDRYTSAYGLRETLREAKEKDSAVYQILHDRAFAERQQVFQDGLKAQAVKVKGDRAK